MFPAPRVSENDSIECSIEFSSQEIGPEIFMRNSTSLVVIGLFSFLVPLARSLVICVFQGMYPCHLVVTFFLHKVGYNIS